MSVQHGLGVTQRSHWIFADNNRLWSLSNKVSRQELLNKTLTSGCHSNKADMYKNQQESCVHSTKHLDLSVR